MITQPTQKTMEPMTNQVVAIGPVTMVIQDDEVVFRFAESNPFLMEVPAFFGENIAAVLERQRDALVDRQPVLDLAWVPGISSRQLGMAMTLRERCQRLGRLRLRGLSPTLRRMLELTRLLSLFEVEPTEKPAPLN